MGIFPSLRTGAIAQYPASSEVEIPTRRLRFVDGKSKYYLERRSKRVWRVTFNQLREDEAARLQEFYRQQRGPMIPFDFVDPATGQTVSNCRFVEASLPVRMEGAEQGHTQLTIAEEV